MQEIRLLNKTITVATPDCSDILLVQMIKRKAGKKSLKTTVIRF
jgi:hypothetical protein